MYGVESRLDDLRTALTTYEKTARFRGEVANKAMVMSTAAIDRSTAAAVDLVRRVDAVLAALPLDGGKADKAARDADAATRERLTAAAGKLVRVAEESGQFPLHSREELEEGPAPKAVTIYVSRMSVKLAHILWPHAQASASRVVAWGAVALTGVLAAWGTAIYRWITE